MSEHEKMLAGELYDAGDPDLVRRRVGSRRLTRLFNTSHEGQAELRTSLLQELLGGPGRDVQIEPPFFCDYGSNIQNGDHVLLGPSVQVYAAHHPVSPADVLAVGNPCRVVRRL